MFAAEKIATDLFTDFSHDPVTAGTSKKRFVMVLLK